jgi:hypothetical protein
MRLGGTCLILISVSGCLHTASFNAPGSSGNRATATEGGLLLTCALVKARDGQCVNYSITNIRESGIFVMENPRFIWQWEWVQTGPGGFTTWGAGSTPFFPPPKLCTFVLLPPKPVSGRPSPLTGQFAIPSYGLKPGTVPIENGVLQIKCEATVVENSQDKPRVVKVVWKGQVQNGVSSSPSGLRQ